MIFIKHKFIKFVKGFSLIELMVVVAIIGVLAMIAVPAYDSYMLRAKVTHISAIADAAKKAIIEYRALTGGYPATISTAYSIPTDRYAILPDGAVTGCKVGGKFEFTITGQNILGAGGTLGPMVTYTATYSGGGSSGSSGGGGTAAGISWTCDYSFPSGSDLNIVNFLPECNKLDAGKITEKKAPGCS